jgi:hypothetical protein
MGLSGLCPYVLARLYSHGVKFSITITNIKNNQFVKRFILPVLEVLVHVHLTPFLWAYGGTSWQAHGVELNCSPHLLTRK